MILDIHTRGCKLETCTSLPLSLSNIYIYMHAFLQDMWAAGQKARGTHMRFARAAPPPGNESAEAGAMRDAV